MAVNGTLSKIQQDFLEMLMNHYDSLKPHLAEIETTLEETMAPYPVILNSQTEAILKAGTKLKESVLAYASAINV